MVTPMRYAQIHFSEGFRLGHATIFGMYDAYQNWSKPLLFRATIQGV